MWNLLHFVLNLWMTIFTIADFTFVVVEAAVVTSHPIGERSIVMSVSVCVSVCVCLSAIISSELHVRSSHRFLCMLPMAVARSSSDGVVICYVVRDM